MITKFGNRFVLKRAHNDEIYFEAAYCKRYQEGYCALFEKYPAQETDILVCEQVEGPTNRYGCRLCKLFFYGANGTVKDMGYFVPYSHVTTEKEANTYIRDTIKGREETEAFIAAVMAGEDL